MTRAPELSWKLRAAEAKEKLAAERAENSKLRAELETERAKVARWIGRNQDLWLAIQKLPGGIELARRLKA